MFKKVHAYFSSYCDNTKLNLNYSMLFIVEGFFDVLKLYQFGFLGVSTMGHSSISARRRGLLFRYFLDLHRFSELTGQNVSGKIVVLGDGDSAGRKYANTLYKELKSDFLRVGMCICPSGKDPADFENKEEFVKFLAEQGIEINGINKTVIDNAKETS